MESEEDRSVCVNTSNSLREVYTAVTASKWHGSELLCLIKLTSVHMVEEFPGEIVLLGEWSEDDLRKILGGKSIASKKSFGHNSGLLLFVPQESNRVNPESLRRHHFGAVMPTTKKEVETHL